jgi:cytochrome P450
MAVIPFSGGLGMGQVIGLATIAVVLYHAFNIIYNLRFHPLSSFPGPPARRASRIPYTLSILRGRLHTDTAALHRKYGPVIRVAPNELAFADPSSWKDVMGGGSKELAKWGDAYLLPAFMAPHLQNTVDKEHHKMLRRAVAPGFSDQSLRAQEPLVSKYIENLTARLRESCIAGKPVFNMEKWYRFTVFDIIGDLALGESFGCLNSAEFHPWIQGMTDSGKVMWLLTMASMYPVARKVSNWLFATIATKGFELHNNLVKPMMERRVAQGTNRPDMINPIIMKKDEWVSEIGLQQHVGDSQLIME